jgi:hypothetical protein
MQLDYRRIASELLIALRGKRSQRAFSRRLGYRSNVAYRWETARCFPTAAETMRAASKVGIDVRGAVSLFLRTHGDGASRPSPATATGIAGLLEDLRLQTPIVEIAKRSGFNRFAVARWLKGTSEPRLPEFLVLIESTSFRLFDFLASLVDPARLPSIAGAWKRLEAARNAAYEHPWSHAVLRALELGEYRSHGRHRPGWLAARLGISPAEEQRCIDLLASAGQIQRRRGLWCVKEVGVVDTRGDRERSRGIKGFWMKTAFERFAGRVDGIYSYNLMAVSESDWVKLRELHVAYFQAMRALVAESKPSERVVLFCTQLLPLDRAGNLAGD